MAESCPEDPLRSSHASTTPGIALGQLYRCHAEAIRRALSRWGVPTAQLEDAVQDVFVVLLRRLADFDPSYGARGWLMGIARRVASGYRRSAGRWHSCRERLSGHDRDVEPTLEDHLAHREAAAMLAEFLGTLDREKSAVYLLAEVQGLRGPEIAEALDVNLNTVYWRLRIAREAFDSMVKRRRKELEEQSILPAWLTAPFGLGPVPAWQTGRGLQAALSLGIVTGVTSATVVADGPALPDPLQLDSAEPAVFVSNRPNIPDDDGVQVWPGPPEPVPVRTLARRPAPRRQPAPAATLSLPAVAKTSVFFTVRSHINEMRGCYNAALTRDPTVGGRVEAVFRIASSGSVTSVEIGRSDISDALLHGCMTQRILQWSFPAADAGNAIVVRYPFVFAPHCDDTDTSKSGAPSLACPSPTTEPA